VVCFTAADNFRKRVLPSYKANRTGGKPLVYQDTVMAVEERFRTERIHGLEGDDLMGILATTVPKYEGAVSVTLDKDMRGYPGLHFNPLKDRQVRLVTLEAANRWWMMQTLMGDPTDGYSGCPGVGEKRAAAALDGARTLEALWRKVVETYRSKKLTEKDALLQARVARILRREDYDRTTKEVLLWHPTAPERLSLLPT
jgi:DNA polymerase-1